MTTQITGDFDIVAELSIPGVNRILAAMHSSGRFPHSISAKVNDNPPPGSKVHGPILVGVVDEFGDSVPNQDHIGNPNPLPGGSATDPIHSMLGQIVNVNFAGIAVPPVTPSHLQGQVQLQVFPPTVSIADPAGTKFTISLEMISRYLPDAHTAPIAEFLRGMLQITAALDQVVTQANNMVDINVKADQVIINYTPSNQALLPEDIAAIDLAVRNALRTSFLPSNTVLPSSLRFVQFKLLPQAPGSVAMLLNLTATGASAPGNPATMNTSFVSANDQFALAVGKNFILSSLQPVLDGISSQFPQDTPAYTSPWGSHVKYSVSLTSISVDLQDSGEIILSISVEAKQLTHHGWAPTTIDVSAQLPFTLQADGTTADLVALDDISVSVNTSGGVLPDWLLSLFQGDFVSAVKNARDQALANSGVYATVRQLLDVNQNLGGFLNSLLTPPTNRPLFQPPLLYLAYTNVEIKAAGIILHGSIAVADQRLVFTLGKMLDAVGAGGTWPAPHVEFEQIPSKAKTSALPQGPDYSALKSWIPGGTIDEFQWSREGQSQPFETDTYKFVLLGSPSQTIAGSAAAASVRFAPSPFMSLCLTVQGHRLSAAGPVVNEPVTASVCGFNLVSVLPGTVEVGAASASETAMIALTQPGPGGQIQVVGHFAAQPDTAGRGTPNVVVYFASAKTASLLDVVARVVNSRKNKTAATVVLAVVPSEQISKLPYTPNVVYAEERDGAWARIFHVKNIDEPVTLIVDPEGRVRWQHAGDFNEAAFSTALENNLVTCGLGWSGLLRSSLRVGQPAPNFLFTYAAGKSLTLRKLAGRKVNLVFWRTSSQPSIDAVRDLQQPVTGAGSDAPLVLAINDGDDPKLAQKVFDANKLTAILVPDPQREISTACGLQVWPTIVAVGSSGLVESIQFSRHHMEMSARSGAQYGCRA
jgi:peroxiredoxin